jgi:hypothetical protein
MLLTTQGPPSTGGGGRVPARHLQREREGNRERLLYVNLYICVSLFTCVILIISRA